MASWIGGYEQLTEMKTVGSGSARWCIAKRHGQRFFLKEFLNPVYPPAEKDSPLATSQRKRCEAFEARKNRLYAALSCVIGDTLVPVLDFFRHEGRYYAISEEVPSPHQDAEEIMGLTTKEIRRILYTLAECLQRLHAQGVVHADLKPEHLLLQKTAEAYSLKLIDLDSGFLEEEPPGEQREIEGDPVYLAPETFLSLLGEKSRLSCKVDTFAFGILIHRLWTGTLPEFDSSKHSYLYEAVLAGSEIRLLPALPLSYRFCVQRMLRKDPKERPNDGEIVRLFAEPGGEKPVFLRDEKGSAPINGLSRFMKE